MKPYYEEAGIKIHHGDCREILPHINADVLVSDPPYGINYSSNMTGHDGGTSLAGIVGDKDSSLRDEIIALWGYNRPAILFGTWKIQRPIATRSVLIWEKGDHVGMGDLSIPWKPNTEEIYILGAGYKGHRGTSVLRYSAPVSWNSTANGRFHSHQKPLDLMVALIVKCPDGEVLDPFMGSGTTLAAAKKVGRKATGIDIEERYCEIAANRLRQSILNFEEAIA